MKSFTIAAILSFSLLVVAQSPPPFDPAGAKNVGNGVGAQFIGGQCDTDADCASGCCANPTGICSGVGAANQAGKKGCGFPNASTDTASAAPPAGTGTTTASSTTPANGGPPFDPNGAHLVGNQAHQQFITGQCINDADCASGCCAGPSGICSGPGASTQNGKTGCGFPNAQLTAGPDFGAADSSSSTTAAPVAAVSPANGGPPFDPAGANNVGKDNAQFIGGQCFNNANCVSGCCAGPSGICSGVGAQTQAGKTGCGFVSRKRMVFF